MNLQESIQIFRDCYEGPRVAVCICGGGYSFFNALAYPGTSKFYYGGLALYDSDDIRSFLRTYANVLYTKETSLCSQEVAKNLAIATQNYFKNGLNRVPDNLLVISCTAALTTDRYRRGENRAFFGTNRNHTYQYNIHKMDKELYTEHICYKPEYIDQARREEDERVAQIILHLISNSNHDLGIFPDISRFNPPETFEIHEESNNDH